MRYVEDFVGKVKARQAEIALSLVAGNAPNYESYLKLVYEHQGLEKALNILNNLLKEDDERQL
jgi:hypothetical protein